MSPGHDGSGAERRRTAEPESDPALDAGYRLLADEVPEPSIDQRLIAAAHRAAGRDATPSPTTARPAPSWLRRWTVPLSVAATLVLSVTMVTTTMRERREPVLAPIEAPEPAAATPSEAPPPASPAPRSVSAPRSAPAPALQLAPAPSPGFARPESEAASQGTISRARVQSGEAAAWLLSIETLVERGETAAARISLERFRAAHPDSEVPRSLNERVAQ